MANCSGGIRLIISKGARTGWVVAAGWVVLAAEANPPSRHVTMNHRRIMIVSYSASKASQIAQDIHFLFNIRQRIVSRVQLHRNRQRIGVGIRDGHVVLDGKLWIGGPGPPDDEPHENRRRASGRDQP